MGKHSMRNEAKRKIDQARGNFGWAVEHLKWIVENYAELHPEIAEPVAIVISTVEQIDTVLVQTDELI